MDKPKTTVTEQRIEVEETAVDHGLTADQAKANMRSLSNEQAHRTRTWIAPQPTRSRLERLF